MIQPLLGALKTLPVGKPPKITWKRASETGSGLHARSPSEDRDSERGELKNFDIARAIQASAGPPSIYISYAWGDDSSQEARRRGQIVEDLCAALEADGWNLVWDRRAMRNGDLITDFMKTITRADRVIAVLSAAYLRKPFCMTELYGIYARSTGEKQNFWIV